MIIILLMIMFTAQRSGVFQQGNFAVVKNLAPTTFGSKKSKKTEKKKKKDNFDNTYQDSSPFFFERTKITD